MKAFLLAAGVGSRLRPLTDHLPKCLIPIEGEPLLGLWFRRLRDHGVSEVLVNTHHLADQVRAFVASQPVEGIEVTLFHEPELLGSAGTVWANRDFVKGEKAFFILYADNLTNMDLTRFYQYHMGKKSVFTLGLFETPEPKQCGIVTLGEDGMVLEFEEKPAFPKSRLANGGMYLADPIMFDSVKLPEKQVTDFGYDVFPLMKKRMYGYLIREYFCDLGTPERLERARSAWAELAEGG